MTIDALARIEPSWLSSDEIDEQNDPITMMSGARVRRNLNGYPFPAACDKSQLFDVAALLLGTIGRSAQWRSCDFRMIDALDSHSKNLLLEANIISEAFAAGGAGRFLLRDEDGTASCMINEEDHLSVSAAYPGFVLSDAAVLHYKCDNFYNRDSETGVRYDDPELGIDWRIPADRICLSEKDACLPGLGDAAYYGE